MTFLKTTSKSISFQISKDIVIYFILVLLFFMVLGGQIYFYQLKKNVSKDFIFTGQIIKEEVQKVLRSKGQNDFSTLTNFIEVSKNIEGVLVLGNNQEKIYHYGPFQTLSLKRIEDFIDSGLFDKSLYGKVNYIFSSDGIKKLAELRVYTSSGHVRQHFKEDISLLGLYALMNAFLICLIVFLWIRKKLGKPLLELTEKISKINYSNLKKIKFDYGEENELSIMAESFNTMIMHTNRFHRLLKKSLDEVEQQNIDLEDTVTERTKDITNILENLGQGFMVFDELGVIQDDVSQAAKEFFQQDLVYDSMANVLKLNDEKRKSFQTWIKQIWDGRLLFKDLVAFGPNTFDEGERHIKLEYRAIYEMKEGHITKKVKKVICISTDISKEKELEIKAQREKNQSQMVLSILENPMDLVDLLSDFKEFSTDFLMEGQDWTLDEIFRKFHTFKAIFSQFRIIEIGDALHELENIIMKMIDESGERKRILKDKETVEIKAKVSLLNNKFYDFMRTNRLIIEMANHALLSEDTNLYIPTKDMVYFLNRNFGKDSKVYNDFEKEFVLRPMSGTFERFETVVNEISHSQGKFVGLEIKDTKLKFNPDNYSGFLSSCVHLFRNAVDHGIEAPRERIDKNKPERGTINVSFEGKNNDFFEVRVRDDGRGISPDKIKSFALKLGFKKEEELKKLSDKEIIQLVFNQGFSSKEEVSKVSGRGVGMDVLKAEAEKIGGKVWVESEIDVGTTFFAELPFSIKQKKFRSS